MPEDEDEDDPEDIDFEAFMENIRERRRERREQASYEWVETVREAGELYRELEDITAVSDELNRSEGITEEALTVYRLIFEDPPEEVASKASKPGRAYFSLERNVETAIDEDEEEPIEDLLREYVGAVYLEYHVGEEPVGDPPDEETPPMAVDFGELAGIFGETTPLSVNLGLSNIDLSGIAGIQSAFDNYPSETLAKTVTNYPKIAAPNLFTELQGSAIADFASTYPALRIADMVEPLTISDALGSTITQQNKAIQAMAAVNTAPLIDTLQVQQDILGSTFQNMIQEITFPASVLSDFASIQPAFSAAVAAGVVADVSTPPTYLRWLDLKFTDLSSSGPAHATIDATLPDSDAFTTELLFEIPALVAEALLSREEVREWYTALPRAYQMGVAGFFVMGVAFLFTSNVGQVSLAVSIVSPIVRQAVINEDEE
jgi:hypothetical protein